MKNPLKVISIIIACSISLFLIVTEFSKSYNNQIDKSSFVDDIISNTTEVAATDTPPQPNNKRDTTDSTTQRLKKPLPVQKKAKEATVLICNSRSSYAYHSHKCSGLKRCKSGIKSITKADAENRGRRPCKFCY